MTDMKWNKGFYIFGWWVILLMYVEHFAFSRLLLLLPTTYTRRQSSLSSTFFLIKGNKVCFLPLLFLKARKKEKFRRFFSTVSFWDWKGKIAIDLYESTLLKWNEWTKYFHCLNLTSSTLAICNQAPSGTCNFKRRAYITWQQYAFLNTFF